MTQLFHYRSIPARFISRPNVRRGVIPAIFLVTLIAGAMGEVRLAHAGPISVTVYDDEGPFEVTEHNWWPDVNTLVIHESHVTGAIGNWDVGVKIAGSPAPNGSYTIDLDKWVTVDPLWTHFTIQLGTGLGNAFVPSTPSDGMYFHFNSVPPPKDESGYFDLDLGNSNGDLFTFVRNANPIWIRDNGNPKPSQFWFRLTVPDNLNGASEVVRFTLRQTPIAIPEPATLLLVGIVGLFWIGLPTRRRDAICGRQLVG